MTTTFRFVLFYSFFVILCSVTAVIDDHDEILWKHIKMPKKSYFQGFEPPNDITKWKQAVEHAMNGDQLLLEKVYQQIHQPSDIVPDERYFNWIHKVGDIFISDSTSFQEMKRYSNKDRAPITLLGHSKFEKPGQEGNVVGFESYGPGQLLDDLINKKIEFPTKFVGIGAMNENWGYLSTHILNRTCVWGFGLKKNVDIRIEDSISLTDQMRPFLDHPNLVMLLINQHHNISHPKVISLPLGISRNGAVKIWEEGLVMLQTKTKKDTLMFSSSSQYRHRPNITSCIKKNMNDSLIALDSFRGPPMPFINFIQKMMTSRTVLALPGLGYDCYRIWEVLLSGSIPVLERGVGLDRTLYRLPALLLDDFAEATPELIRQAYVEALYRIDEWEYNRITAKYWLNLIQNASITRNHLHLLQQHPMEAEDRSFTRPIVPFDCKAMGGCGKGTKRVPTKSCGIDFNKDITKYDWNWFENWEKAEDEKKKLAKEMELKRPKDQSQSQTQVVDLPKQKQPQQQQQQQQQQSFLNVVDSFKTDNETNIHNGHNNHHHHRKRKRKEGSVLVEEF